MRNRKVHVQEIWGTVVSIDISLFRTDIDFVQPAIDEVMQWFRDVDLVFSTYKKDSVVNQLRDGRISVDEIDAGVADVITRCTLIKEITAGTFDPWAVPGGFDPSGMVKGWAADRAADILLEHGLPDFMINAGGDVTVRGFADKAIAWSIGIAHPYLKGEICESVSITQGAIATSGRYERGDHIVNPHGEAIGCSSATVVGPDCAVADAMATALLIKGQTGFNWIAQLPGYSAHIVEGNQMFSFGPAFEKQVASGQ